MLVKRFGLAKVTENTISTPALWRVDDDIKFEDGYFIFPGGKIEKKIFFPPEIGEMEIKLNNDIYLILSVFILFAMHRPVFLYSWIHCNNVRKADLSPITDHRTRRFCHLHGIIRGSVIDHQHPGPHTSAPSIRPTRSPAPRHGTGLLQASSCHALRAVMCDL